VLFLLFVKAKKPMTKDLHETGVIKESFQDKLWRERTMKPFKGRFG